MFLQVLFYFIDSLVNAYLKITTGNCEHPVWVGDGYCDDLTNTEECDYDGGDCCGSCVNAEFCSVCECLGEETGMQEITCKWFW